ncbi:MAG: hypothetical protein WDZ83_05295 [Rhizobiaceae bacterium]
MFRFGTAGKAKITQEDFLKAPNEIEYPRLIVLPSFEPAMTLSARQNDVTEQPIRLWISDLENGRIDQSVLTDPVVIENAYTSTNDILWSIDITMGDGRSVGLRHRLPLRKFMRMLAKIAYSYAVAEHGFEELEKSEIRQVVRGERDDLHNFVGGALHGERLTNRYLHHLAFRERGNYRTVIVHLLASFGAPAYEVSVGRK